MGKVAWKNMYKYCKLIISMHIEMLPRKELIIVILTCMLEYIVNPSYWCSLDYKNQLLNIRLQISFWSDEIML